MKIDYDEVAGELEALAKYPVANTPPLIDVTASQALKLLRRYRKGLEYIRKIETYGGKAIYLKDLRKVVGEILEGNIDEMG